MHAFSFLSISLTFLLSAIASGMPDPSPQSGKWNLVWSDEFDGNGLPDKNKWDFEEGFVRNKETQYYTRDRLENARLENGNLVIECRKEQYVPDNKPPVEYTSASLTTKGKVGWKYGKVEVRAKIPEGKGVWPAIWMMGESKMSGIKWPFCGEIDIMENVGKTPDKIYGTLHYAVDGKHQKDHGSIQVENCSKDFHDYAVEWTSERIDFFVDGRNYKSVLLDQAGTGDANPFRQPFYLLINFALGGNWGGPVDESILPQKYLIDYVRVYQREGSENVTIHPDSK